jgi:hypothetical protein
MPLLISNGYMKTAGRMTVLIFLGALQLQVMIAISKADPSEADALSREMAVNIGPLSTSLLAVPFYLVAVWAFAPLIVQAINDIREAFYHA